MKNSFLLLCVLICQITHSQPQTIEELRHRFAFEVKSIDDFMGKFNADSNTYFSRYVRSINPNTHISRDIYLKMLFDKKSSSNDSGLVSKFIYQVTQDNNPTYLKFTHPDWFSKVDCLVNIDGKKTSSITLVLQPMSTNRGGYCWVLAATSPLSLSEMQRANSKDTTLLCPSLKGPSQSYFLSPVSHGLDFMNLTELFNAKDKIGFLVSSRYCNNNLLNFCSFIRNNRIKFINISRISYYFFQIKGWGLVVNRRNRGEVYNSGWLIDKLFQFNTLSEIEKFKNKNLFL